MNPLTVIFEQPEFLSKTILQYLQKVAEKDSKYFENVDLYIAAPHEEHDFVRQVTKGLGGRQNSK